ncbi:MAG: hypothetical protein N3D73_00380 [Candidatus Diapherotrites archaeon]|nr:hypothetical protein [Candidatus Diapherotrites archaeon]
MEDLKDKEERLRFLLSKIEDEIDRFSKMQEIIETKNRELFVEISKKGLTETPLEIAPHSDGHQSLLDEVREHILELNKVKSYLSAKLDLILKEEELIEALKKKYGNNVNLLKRADGVFEISYTDEETKNTYLKLKASKKLLSDLKSSIGDLVKENF